jgi:predicted nucleic acid-binding protein
MASIWGYRDFLRVLTKQPSIKSGLVLDTNVLISATYDGDTSFDQTVEFFDLIAENSVPVFCNANVRMEFLEIHRRIIFTEALLDFSSVIDKALLPPALVKTLNSWTTQNSTRKKAGKTPLRLGEADLKSAKFQLSSISDGQRDLWTVLCSDRIGNKLTKLWEKTESELGLNFLSLRKSDQTESEEKPAAWPATIALVEQEGLSSTDAAIISSFLASDFGAFLTSDQEVATTIKKLAGVNRGCFVPDHIFKSFEAAAGG